VRPVQEPSFLVLTVLADGERHGYGIIVEAEKLSKGRSHLRPGTLYSTLDRLVAEQLIEVASEEVVDGRFRRYYRITGLGAAELEAESRHRAQTSREALRRLRLAGGAA
jgi:DNA-binding PadR family transcriptional regulator